MSEDELELARSFHGHLGPFLALGMLIGVRALEFLRARKYFGVKVVVRCPPNPPQSCIVDGLQLSTGATYGKRNIELIPSDDIVVEFINTDTGEGIHMLISGDTIEKLKGWLNELGDEGATRMVISCGEELFELAQR
ncbi:MAG: formylmethanofuran dehydrogenase subunit E family protein [Armatimonadota bacterium]|nr:formylmethanofuran dehydrogenase subunit E family protein [Armatimonadota bacterium]MCX7777506.1 formylmethanofuran dehydrogenase subunit E family protein [Armatimonadota bacterium]MDW8025982.1 formylmethanofuran dehydrogenase subunit E family protein [Armatimonadota bacterium]